MQLSKKTGWIAIVGFILIILFFSQQDTTQSNQLSKSVAKKILSANQEYQASDIVLDVLGVMTAIMIVGLGRAVVRGVRRGLGLVLDPKRQNSCKSKFWFWKK